MRIVRRSSDAKVGHHPLGDELRRDEFPHQRQTFPGVQLDGQSNFDHPRQLRILSELGGLDTIPQCFAVPYPRRNALGRHNLRVHDRALTDIVVGDAVTLVSQQIAGSISRGGHSGLAAGPRDDVHRQMIDRQKGPRAAKPECSPIRTASVIRISAMRPIQACRSIQACRLSIGTVTRTAPPRRAPRGPGSAALSNIV
jgi:hypothetical protein